MANYIAFTSILKMQMHNLTMYVHEERCKIAVLMNKRPVVLVVPVRCRKWRSIERHHNPAAECSAGKAEAQAQATAA